MNKSELLDLPYVSENVALQIIDFRPFTSWKDLEVKVKGLGEKRVEKIQTLCTLDNVDDTKTTEENSENIEKTTSLENEGEDLIESLVQNIKDLSVEDQTGEKRDVLCLNKASEAQLADIKGLTVIAEKQIIEKRPFIDWNDLQKRVSGIGSKTVQNLQKSTDPFITVTDDEIPGEAAKNIPVVKEGESPQEPLPEWYNLDRFPKDIDQTKEILISSWNIRHFSVKRKPPMKKIAKVLEKFTIIAIQEIRDPKVLDSLITIMGEKWKYEISTEIKYGKNKDRQFTEYYAFLYDSSHVSVQSECKVLDSDGLFWREPLVGYFKGNQIDFVLCTVHLVWSGDREREADLMGKLLEKIRSFTEGEQDLLLLGDFNMEYDDESFSSMNTKEHAYLPLIDRKSGSSTFSSRTPDGKLYDNIWGSESIVKNCKNSGVFYFDLEHYEINESGRKLAKKEMSDHRPVWALFKDEKDEDEALRLDFEKLKI
eukprot:UN05223